MKERMKSMANNIIQVILDYRFVNANKAWQYDYGQILRIKGENLPETAEVHFSLNETGGDSITKVGVTTDGVAEVQVPDELLENGDTMFNYNIYAFVYIEDGTSGSTEYRIKIPVQARPKPSDHVTPDNTDTDPFGDVVKAVNNAAERAATSERNAKEYADNASESAEQAKQVATKNGFCKLEIDESGHLKLHRTDNIIDSLDFRLTEKGSLEVMMS